MATCIICQQMNDEIKLVRDKCRKCLYFLEIEKRLIDKRNVYPFFFFQKNHLVEIKIQTLADPDKKHHNFYFESNGEYWGYNRKNIQSYQGHEIHSFIIAERFSNLIGVARVVKTPEEIVIADKLVRYKYGI